MRVTCCTATKGWEKKRDRVWGAIRTEETGDNSLIDGVAYSAAYFYEKRMGGHGRTHMSPHEHKHMHPSRDTHTHESTEQHSKELRELNLFLFPHATQPISYTRDT